MSLPTTSVDFSGLTLGYGTPYRIDSLAGWEELPSTRFEDVQRPNAHGAFDSVVYASARTVAISGWCFELDARDAILEALRRQVGLQAGLAPLSVTVAGRTLTSQARVTKAGAILTRGEWGIGRFGWQVEWRCPDPLRYSESVPASCGFPGSSGGLTFPLFAPDGVLDFGVLADPGSVTVRNEGTADAPVRLRVDGPTPPEGFDLVDVDTGRRLRYIDAIPAGSWVDLDSATGTVTINGQADRSGFLSIAQWWQVPAGGSSTVAFVPLGASNTQARLTASVAPAWW